MSVTKNTKRTGLPFLRAPYDTNQDYNAIAVGSPRSRAFQEHQAQIPVETVRIPVPVEQQIVTRYEGPSRLEVLEERLAQQERNSQALIERAFKIKEDVIESLNFTHGTWQEEKNARTHLAEHIRTITAVVNRLNHDIAVLEESIKARDTASVGTNNAVKNLEVHHVASLSDLRGRVVRCDTSIAKLSVDMRTSFDSIRTLSNQQQEMQSRLMDRMHGIEGQLMSITSHIERLSGESKIKLQHLEGDTNQHLTMLDSKTRQLIEDLKNTVSSLTATADSERDRMEQRLIGLIDKSTSARDLMVEKVEKKTDDIQYSLEARVQKLEEALLEERGHLSDLQSHLESRLLAKLDSDIRRQAEELAKLKRECREGFSTVHESISNMKTVVEGKRKLLEDQLRKEISQLRKMVVLV